MLLALAFKHVRVIFWIKENQSPFTKEEFTNII